jgi:hypothetical protein
MRPARARKTGRLQQAEGGLFCWRGAVKRRGKKVLRATRTGAGFASDRGYGDGAAASPEEALIGNQSRPQICAGNCRRFCCRCSWAIVERIEQVELTGGLRSLAAGADRPGWRQPPANPERFTAPSAARSASKCPVPITQSVRTRATRNPPAYWRSSLSIPRTAP